MVDLHVGDDRYPAAMHDSLPHPLHHHFHTVAVQDGGKVRRGLAPEVARVPLHHREVRADKRGEVRLVYYQEPRAGNAGATLAWHLVSTGHVYNVYGGVHEFRAERSRQVVAAALDKDHVEVRETLLQVLYRHQVHRDVVPDRGVRAAAGLDPYDPALRQDRSSLQKLGILTGVDIVSDSGDLELLPEPPAQLGHQCRLTGTDRSPDPQF